MRLNRLSMEEVFGEEIEAFPKPRILHVVNMALNLVKGEKLAWQRRKAESFTTTALHSGSCRGGYRRSAVYGGDLGISLGTAVATSGAAASPNMGYHSSPALTFLMTCFNARLGWWLDNPGRAGSWTYLRSGPRLAVAPLISEALGLTDSDQPYVYLSDGGHFENLALYEMILRRCHFIIGCDSGCDPECGFEDPGNAMRKIRIDMCVPIEFGKIPVYSRKSQKDGRYFALGRIRYSAKDELEKDGLLLYIKPALFGREPADVLNYAHGSPVFPHEGTADQWFSESQFESHRALGAFVLQEVVDEICGKGWAGDMDDFVTKCRDYWKNQP